MISMNCSCRGEFWVRDRLAGTSTNCPSCGASLAVPTLETVRETLSPAACTCGEVFWSAAWRQGRHSRCPICGDVVGPSKSTGATTVIVPPGSKSRLSPVPEPSAGRSEGGGDEHPGPTGAAEERKGGTSGSETDRGPRGLVFAVVGLGLLALGAFLGSRFLPRSPEAGNNPQELLSNNGALEADREGGPDEAEGVGPLSNRGVSQGVSNPLKLLVPAYFYPGGPGLEDWFRLITAADRVPIVVIVNPNSGPGETLIREYADVIRRGTEAGLTMIGYVNTGFAKRPRSEVEGDLDRWVRFYPEIGGIFLDAQSSGAEDTAYYAALHEIADRKIDGALVIGNPGTLCAEEYFKESATDVAVIFENAGGFSEFYPPLWADRYEAERFAALPYSVSTVKEMEETVRHAVRKQIGYLYVTDGDSENPWAGLPTYWDELLNVIERTQSVDPTAKP